MKKCRFEGYLTYYDLEGHGFSESYHTVEMEAVENCDPSPSGEWEIQFSPGDTWHSPFSGVYFDFENANKILCQLVQYDCIYVTDERNRFPSEEANALLNGQGPFFLEIAKKEQAAFGSTREVKLNGVDCYRYILKFSDPLTTYRIHNRVTGEVVMGDALICPK